MADTRKKVAWVAVDWGTSNLRLWLMSEAGEALEQLSSEQGMSVLEPQEFEGVLLSLLRGHLSDETAMPVICCGMVGSRQGWAEAKYLTAPCAPPSGAEATKVKTIDPRISVYILPGIKQISPPDVMRGEETQIAGFVNLNPDFTGVLCLPGTHTKWVRLKAGKISDFQTFMTGEMFSLLSKKSVLRHAMKTKGWDHSAFESAIAESMEQPEMAAAKLFALRASNLIADQSPETAIARLSGLLIGLELAAVRAYWQDNSIAVIGADFIADIYRSSLAALGVDCAIAEATTMTLTGLTAARLATKECA